MAKTYLVAYNAVQLSGWFYVLVLINLALLNGLPFAEIWQQVKFPLSVFQTLQLIEVVHCAVGLVPSSPLTTFMQIISRIFVVWCISWPIAQSTHSVGTVFAFGAWSVAEVTRYLYYLLNLVSRVPYAVTWCRYTFFTFLYPLGVSGELLLMLASLPMLAKTLVVDLPNAANVSFRASWLVVGVMLSYIPLFPPMYAHMLSQRRKTIGGGGEKRKSN